MSVRILTGDCRDVLKTMPDESVHCCVSSPPYFGLRSYLPDGHPDKHKEIGLEASPDEYVSKMVDVFREVRRVLRSDGTLWLNLGDSYANDGKWGGHSGGKHVAALHASPIGRNKRYTGLKPKDLIGIPWMVAFALRQDGWWLRQSQPWVKRNPMPESTKDRPTNSVETVFLLSKSEVYFYDYDAVKQVRTSNEGANGFRGGSYTGGNIDNSTTGKRLSVGNKRVDKQRGHSRRHAGFNDRWDEMEKSEQQESRAFRNSDLFFASIQTPHGAIGNDEEVIAFDVATQPYKESHFATFPPRLIEPMIKAGCPVGGTILDPFGGAGTTGMVADRLQRNAILIELHPDYPDMARNRVSKDAGLFAEFAA
jgi:DNA modification methylase